MDRSQYRASQTPQAFRLPLLLHAYQQATPHDFEHGTECLHLALTYSQCKARLIEGTANLFKVTYKPDIYAAEQMIKERYRQVRRKERGHKGNNKVQVPFQALVLSSN